MDYPLELLLTLAVAIAAAVVVNFVVFRLLRRVSEKSPYLPAGTFKKHCASPCRWTLILIAVHFALTSTEFGDRFRSAATHAVSLGLIACVSWLIIRLGDVLNDYIAARFDVSQKDNLQARKIHTQLRVIRRVLTVVVIIIAVGTMLMTFQRVRQLGTTILASAGIAGIVIGFAAQRTLGTFLAGLQIALTQPIRVDDVVIVEGEWGRIEEITLTYVVVKIWDLRRLIVPVTYFIEKPFQNWTRTSSELLGTVFIYVDYTVPFDAVREELQRILEKSEHWDKKVCVLQVTNATERTVEMRALMSAGDASAAWTLRCEVRERLIEYIQKNYPAALPKSRVELEKAEEGGA